MPGDDLSIVDGWLQELPSTTTASREAADYEVDGAVPLAVVTPGDVEELSQVVASASRHGVALAPWGGGTRTDLGNRPERLDAVVDMSALDRVVAHNPADLTGTFEGGMCFSALQQALGEHGQFLAVDPPLPERATVGGTLAVGAGGALKWQYWAPRDLVIGMKVVQGDGTVTKSGGQVVKNVSGYDMTRLHVGGLGTLGIICEVSFKLTPRPRVQKTVLASYETTGDSIRAALDVFQGDVMPLALATFDREAGLRMGAAGSERGSALAIRLGGRPMTVERQVRECRSACDRHDPSAVDVLEEAESADLWRGIADFGWAGEVRPTVGMRASVAPSQALGLTEALELIGPDEGHGPAVVSHPAHGTVSASWSGEAGVPSTKGALDIVQRARAAAHAHGGRAVVEQCPLEVKVGIDVWDDVGDTLDIMRRMKEQYDPNRTLNPGRFAGGI